MVAIVTDSTADLSPENAARLGVRIVPLVVSIDGQTYEDGVDLAPADFYRKLSQARAVPSTSQPALGRFKQAYEGLDADEIVSIHLSSTLSGTLNAAAAAAQEMAGKRITVLDSRTLSLSLGYLVELAAEAAAAGESVEGITALVESAIPRTGFVGVLDSLQHAQRSGRLSSAQALLASVLRIKPIIALRDGQVQAIDKPRTMRKAVDRLVELVSAEAPLAFVAIPHAANEGLAQDLAKGLASLAPGPIQVVATGAVLGTHCGPGAAAVCFARRQ